MIVEVVVLGITGLINGSWTLYCEKKFWNFAQKVNLKLVYFVFISYPFRFYLDNFMQILVTCFIDINFNLDKIKWNLATIKTPYLLSIIFGMIFVFVQFCILVFVIIKITCWLWKSKLQLQKASSLFVLIVGLNQKRFCHSLFYFSHYLFIRILIAILILCTPYERSIVLVSVLLVG